MSRPTIPPNGRLIGVDYGHVRIGLATCDADRRIASPLETYTRRGSDQDAAYFQKLAAIESAVGWVVGLPLMTQTGDEGTKAKECRAFGTWLGQLTGLSVAYQDERYTSSAAEDALWGAGLTHKKRRSRRDRVAAQFILQAFLDAGCPSPGEPGASATK
ncbi:MAG TPA: Holliday junction resolvase RuvX [Fimbriiglobus sp.]|nr:Holliday junction resolvase RuvX [Fimbriiglobus sp.]